MECTIKEAAEQVGLTVHTVRYYEKEGLLPALKRDQHGNRIFEESDIQWLGLITCLRNTGMSIAEMRRIVELSMDGEHTIPQRKKILEEHKRAMEEKMKEIKRTFKRIDEKLAWYDMLEQQKSTCTVLNTRCLTCEEN